MNEDIVLNQYFSTSSQWKGVICRLLLHDFFSSQLKTMWCSPMRWSLSQVKYAGPVDGTSTWPWVMCKSTGSLSSTLLWSSSSWLVSVFAISFPRNFLALIRPKQIMVGGTSRFTVVSCHPNVCRCPSIRLHPSVPDLFMQYFLRYFLQFFANGFQNLRYGNHGQDLELVNFLWPWLNFQGHRSLCFKIHFVYTMFPVVLCSWVSH